MLLFKNYEYFIAIVEEGSISKAAEKLYVSQPSLSKYLKRMEENIGTELFSRDSYPLQLTEAGELYLHYLKDIIFKKKKIEQDFASLKDSNRGTVTVGITVWRSSIMLPTVLPGFWQKYPNIKIQVREGSHQFLASAMEKGKVDFCVSHLPSSYHNATFEHLMNERILFAVKNDHPLLKQIAPYTEGEVSTISQEEFKLFREEPFILLMEGQNMREITQNYFNKLEIVPKIALETSNIVTALHMAQVGMGVTFVSEAALKVAGQTTGLVCFAVDYPPLQWEVAITYKTNNYPGSLARKFIDEIKSHYMIGE